MVTDDEQSESEDMQSQENECGNATIANGNNVAATKECPIAKEFDVQDEMCDDETYEDKSSRLDVMSDNMNDVELLTVKLKEGFVRREAGEVVLEVRPQYCKFDENELASKLV